MAQMIFNPGQFTAPKAKPLPIILLLDTSGSMNTVTNPEDVRRTGRRGVDDGCTVEYVENGIARIDVLNKAVKKMVRTFAQYERNETEFLVAIITFGEDTRLVLPPSPASDVRFTNLEANGNTPLGEGLSIAKKLIEDKNQIPSRSYRPLIILVSDGEPDEGWQTPFDDFTQNGRSAKCDRMALAIGNDANRTMLSKFIEGTGHDVFEAENAEEITNFFKFATMSVVTRTLSSNPDIVPKDAEVKEPPRLARKPGKPEPIGTEQAASNKQESPASHDDDDDDDDDGYFFVRKK
ncbi:MAG: von Willebrand factor type A domain protein [Lentisphaerae bacterium ADurb.Bin082]|nr:MAG: von Willebrand factor type A domain protein [Lentisphaerae bacterium ADurb.Bin082]